MVARQHQELRQLWLAKQALELELASKLQVEKAMSLVQEEKSRLEQELADVTKTAKLHGELEVRPCVQTPVDLLLLLLLLLLG